MTADAVLKDGMEGLIRAGHYKNKDALFEEAFRTLLEVRPAIRTEMAIELYKSEKSRFPELQKLQVHPLRDLRIFWISKELPGWMQLPARKI